MVGKDLETWGIGGSREGSIHPRGSPGPAVWCPCHSRARGGLASHTSRGRENYCGANVKGGRCYRPRSEGDMMTAEVLIFLLRGLSKDIKPGPTFTHDNAYLPGGTDVRVRQKQLDTTLRKTVEYVSKTQTPLLSQPPTTSNKISMPTGTTTTTPLKPTFTR